MGGFFGVAAKDDCVQHYQANLVHIMLTTSTCMVVYLGL